MSCSREAHADALCRYNFRGCIMGSPFRKPHPCLQGLAGAEPLAVVGDHQAPLVVAFVPQLGQPLVAVLGILRSGLAGWSSPQEAPCIGRAFGLKMVEWWDHKAPLITLRWNLGPLTTLQDFRPGSTLTPKLGPTRADILDGDMSLLPTREDDCTTWRALALKRALLRGVRGEEDLGDAPGACCRDGSSSSSTGARTN